MHRRTLIASSLALLAGCTPLRSGADRADGGASDTSVPSDAGGEPTLDSGPLGCPAVEDRAVQSVAADTEYTEDTTWDCRHLWVLAGNVLVTGGTLTIEPGTVVRVADDAFVLVARTARIEAIGTRDAPIVMQPSTRPVPVERGSQWRGLVMLGQARTALGSSSSVVETVLDTDMHGDFGGTDDTHDCGRLSYVRIEFAGGDQALQDEYYLPAAGLTLAGCGSGTRVDHVQVHRGGDGIGLIGGTVPLTHLLVTDPDEDGIEWAAGYRGFIQFAIVQTFPGSSGALQGSRVEGGAVGEPESEPVLYNVTLVGSHTPLAGASANGFESGVILQAATLGSLRNSIVQGFAGYWANVIDTETGARFSSGRVGISNTLFFDRAMPPRGAFPPGAPAEDEDGDFDELEQFTARSVGNRVLGVPRLLRMPYAPPPAAPDFTADSTIASGSFAEPPGEWAIAVDAEYYGALPPVGDNIAERERADWTLGWTDHPTE